MHAFRIAAVISLLAAAPVAARDETSAAPAAFPERQFGDWAVYAVKRSDCWMKTVGASGSELLLSTSDDDNDLYVVMRKRAWTFIKEDDVNRMRVQFSGVDVDKDSSGSADGTLTPGTVMFLDEKGRDYLADLRRSSVIRLWFRGKPAMVVSLAKAGPALDYFARCTRWIQSSGAKR